MTQANRRLKPPTTINTAPICGATLGPWTCGLAPHDASVMHEQRMQSEPDADPEERYSGTIRWNLPSSE